MSLQKNPLSTKKVMDDMKNKKAIKKKQKTTNDDQNKSFPTHNYIKYKQIKLPNQKL